MLSSPVTDAMRAQMTAVILRDSEGNFDDPKEREDLQITVRVACEFFVFLKQSNDPLELGEAEYMAETIRSDWIVFSGWLRPGLPDWIKIAKWLRRELAKHFVRTESLYNSVFHEVLECTYSVKAIGLLLSLVQMMFLFRTVYFPSFLSFSGESATD